MQIPHSPGETERWGPKDRSRYSLPWCARSKQAVLSRARAVKKAASQVEDRQQEIERREHQLRSREVDLDRRTRSIDDLVSQASEAEQKAVVLAAEKSALEHRLKMLEVSLANDKALAREARHDQELTLG